jgi:hypothetical protein
MTIDRFVFAFGGALVFAGVLLGTFVDPLWLILPGFVGLNMFQAAFTGFCPLALILKKAGFQPGVAFR